MKRGIFFLLLFVFSCENSKTVAGMLEGLGKNDGNMKVLYKPAWDRKAEPKILNLEKNGKFSIKINDVDVYKFIFAMPNHEPKEIELDLGQANHFEFNVALDAYKKAENYKVITSFTGMSFGDAVEMTKDGENFVVTIENIPDSIKMIDYQILAERSFNGNDIINRSDEAGDFLSEVAVKDGKASIVFNDSHLREEKSKAGFENLKNADYAIALDSFWKEYIKYRPILKKKQFAEEFNKNGIEKLINYSLKNVEKLNSENDKLRFSEFLEFIYGKFSDDFQEMTEKAWRKAKSDLIFASSLEYDGFIRAFSYQNENASAQDKIVFIDKILAVNISTKHKINLLSKKAKILQEVNTEKAVEAYDYLIKTYPTSLAAAYAKMDKSKLTLVGKEAPEIVYNDYNGKEFKLSDLRGKYVLLDVWATWCGPCIREVPFLREAYEKLDKNQVEFLSVCIDAEGEKLKKFVEKKKMTWKHMGTLGNFKTKIVKDYGIGGIPFMLFLDKEGKIVVADGSKLRGGNLPSTIKKIAGETAFLK